MLLSVRDATSSDISRRVNSWTRSRNSERSAEVGGSKPLGCLEEACRCETRGRADLAIIRDTGRASRRTTTGDAMIKTCVSILRKLKRFLLHGQDESSLMQARLNKSLYVEKFGVNRRCIDITPLVAEVICGECE